MANLKAYFAPVPWRALVDGRLKLSHLRVLGVIAAHDRFGVNGLGCTLATRRMAEILQSEQPTVATACRKLIDWGYLRQDQHPDHAQKRMLSVIYGAADGDAFKRQTDMPEKIGSPPATDMPEKIGEAPNRYAGEDHKDTPLKEGKIFRSKRRKQMPLQAGLDVHEDFRLGDPVTASFCGALEDVPTIAEERSSDARVKSDGCGKSSA